MGDTRIEILFANKEPSSQILGCQPGKVRSSREGGRGERPSAKAVQRCHL